MKKGVKFGLSALLAVLVTAGAAILLISQIFSDHNIRIYYTQVDNSRIKENHSVGGVIDLTGGLAYSYMLPCYDEDGNGKDIEFGMSRKLTEGAFLQLEVMPMRGVVNWGEVQYDELPEAVQSHYAVP